MSLAWTVLSTACRLAQDAGLHRASSYTGTHSNEERRKHKWLFWILYSFDHCFALLFGRAPNIQDYDISVSRPDFTDPESMQSGQIVGWIQLASLQGRVYSELYSAAAQHIAIETKVDTALKLAAEFRLLEQNARPLYENLGIPDYRRGATASAAVVIYSSMTMALKVIPPPGMTASGPMHFCDECVQVARKALTLLNEGWEIVNIKNSEGMSLSPVASACPKTNFPAQSPFKASFMFKVFSLESILSSLHFSIHY